jgi:hypothetical protein
MDKPKKLKELVSNAYNKALNRKVSTVETDFGTRKKIEKLNKPGDFAQPYKSQKTIDKDASGKLLKKEVVKHKSQLHSSGSGSKNIYATKTTKVPGEKKTTSRVYGHKLPKTEL